MGPDEKMGIKKFTIFIIFLFVIQPVFSQNTYILSGSQSKYGQRFSSKLQSKEVTLTEKAAITKISGGKYGFWINKKEGYNVRNLYKFKNPQDAIGKTLKNGTYTVYPNLGDNEKYQKVSVYLKPGGEAIIDKENYTSGKNTYTQKKDIESNDIFEEKINWETEEESTNGWDF